MDGVQSIPLAVVLVSGVVAGVTDVWKFRVYNLLTLPLLITGLVYHAVAGGWPGVSYAMAGATFGFLVFLIPYVLGGMGAGDVKLMAGVGSWLGMPATFQVFVAASLVTGLYAVILMVRQQRVAATLANLQIIFYQTLAMVRHLGPEERVTAAVHRDDRRCRLIPFAAMVPVGILAVLFWDYWQA